MTLQRGKWNIYRNSVPLATATIFFALKRSTLNGIYSVTIGVFAILLSIITNIIIFSSTYERKISFRCFCSSVKLLRIFGNERKIPSWRYRHLSLPFPTPSINIWYAFHSSNNSLLILPSHRYPLVSLFVYLGYRFPKDIFPSGVRLFFNILFPLDTVLPFFGRSLE